MSVADCITCIRRRIARALVALLASAALLGAAAARADAITDWAAVLEEATLGAPNPTLPIRAAAMNGLTT